MLLFSVILTGCKKAKNRICELYDSPVGYAVGFIEDYESSAVKVHYTYSYYVDSISYAGTEKVYGLWKKDTDMLGRSFLVVYALGEPLNSDLNTDHSLTTEMDLQQFTDEHQGSPPPPDFPNRCR